MLEVELKAVGYYAMLNSWQPSEDSTAFVDPVASFAKLGKIDNLEIFQRVFISMCRYYIRSIIRGSRETFVKLTIDSG